MATMKTLNGYGFNATELNGKAPEYYLQPRNLLDNSGFEIAQAGYGGKHGSTVYVADRWMQNDTTERTYTYTTKNGHGALKCSTDTRIQQKLHLVDGQNYTAAFYVNNTLHILNFTANGAENGSGAIRVNKQSDGTYMFIISNIPADGIVYEPVLYIGSYTADTLPPYVPKGYGAELAECQRQYFEIPSNTGFFGFFGGSGTVAYVYVDLPQELRVYNPSYTLDGQITMYFSGGSKASRTINSVDAHGKQIELRVAVDGAQSASIFNGYIGGGNLKLSADL